jgi:tetratricopeptide (TPR) repeat protein
VKTLPLKSTSWLVLLVTVLVCSCTTTQTSTPPPYVGLDDLISPQGDVGILSKEEQDFSKALAYYVSGLIHRSRDEKTQSMEDFTQVVLLDPTREDLREVMIQESFRNSDYKKAIEILKTSVQRKPDSFSHWLLLSVAYRAEKQWTKAAESVKTALRLDPTKILAHEVLFETTQELEGPEKAKKVLDRAARQQSSDHQFWVKLADLYATHSTRFPHLGIEKEEIIQLYDRAMHLNADDPVVLTRVADFHVTSQDYPKAIELYKKILTLQQNVENVRLRLGLAYVAKGDKKQAIEEFQQIVQKEPFRYQVFTMIGELYEELKEWEQALAHYRLSLGANPNQLVPHLKIVLLEMRNKRNEEVLKQLAVAREKFPNTPQISYFYGLAYSESKDYPKAIEYFEEASRLASASNPEMLDGVFHFYYGAALERNGQFDRAVTAFKKAIELNPDYADAYNYLGFMYADKKQNLEEAHDLIEKALAYEPENGAFLDSFGWVLFRLGKFDKALLYLQEAAKWTRDDAVIFDHMGDVYREMGKHVDALEYYEKAKSLDPSNKEILQKLEDLRKSLSFTNPPKSSP